MGFPRQVNVQAAPAVLGDFCDANPRATVDAGAGAFVAGSSGVLIGRFGWINADGITISNTGSGAPTGFVRRDQQSIITQYLAETSLSIAAGFPLTLFNEGGFWVYNAGSTTSAIGNTAYASNSDGSISFNVAGTPPTSGSATSTTLARIISASTGGALPTTNTSTGSIAGTTLTVTAVGSGSVLGVGQTISGGNSTVGYIDPNTTIVSQTSGTAGGIGVYQVSISQTILSTTITMSGGGLTLTGANTSGIFAIGMTISGTNIPTGTTITGYGTATAGGAGTYTVDRVAATAATASTITAANAMFMTVDGSSTGTWALNDLIVSSGITAGTYITATGAQNANLTGLGGAGTYLTNNFQTAITAQTFGVNSGTATKWVASSVGAPGELVKMTTWLNG